MFLYHLGFSVLSVFGPTRDRVEILRRNIVKDIVLSVQSCHCESLIVFPVAEATFIAFERSRFNAFGTINSRNRNFHSRERVAKKYFVAMKLERIQCVLCCKFLCIFFFFSKLSNAKNEDCRKKTSRSNKSLDRNFIPRKNTI